MDYELPQFKSSLVFQACKMDANTMRGHFMRKNFRMIGDVKTAEIEGHAHRFSARDGIGLVATCALMRVGVPAAAAFEIGMVKFAHTARPGLKLGEFLFDEREDGRTLAVFYPEKGEGGVVLCPDQSSLEDVFRLEAPGHQGVQFVLLNGVVREALAMFETHQAAKTERSSKSRALRREFA